MKRTKPPFRADHVGSLLRPASLKQARERRAKGEISAADLKAVEDREIERVIKKQEDVGLQAVTYGEFLDLIRDPDRPSAIASWFWGVQEVPGVVERWGGTLPADHVHLVTVPHPGAPRDLLWERFAGVFGIEH